MPSVYRSEPEWHRLSGKGAGARAKAGNRGTQKDLKFRVAYVSRKGGGVRDKCLTYHPRVWPVPRAVLLAIMHTFLGNLQVHK